MVGMISYIKTSISDQFVDYSPTIPLYNWSEARQTFYIVSAMGILEYQSLKPREINAFRDKWINRFSLICEKHKSGKKVTRDLFKFYHDAREVKGVRYRANFRTRVRLSLGVC